MRVLKKVNAKLKFLERQNKYLTRRLKRLLCNALIQPYFHYRCTSWFSLLNIYLKYKLQTVQNKCIRLCLDLPPCSHIGVVHFRNINQLSVSERVYSCIATTVFNSAMVEFLIKQKPIDRSMDWFLYDKNFCHKRVKYWNGIVPLHISDMFHPSLSSHIARSQIALNIALRKTNTIFSRTENMD